MEKNWYDVYIIKKNKRNPDDEDDQEDNIFSTWEDGI